LAINKVSIIGMGSLGLIFGGIIFDSIGRENIEFVMDEERFEKYSGLESSINNKHYNFKIVPDSEKGKPSDLLIFAVKSTGLNDAINITRNKVSEDTIIISLLNGITSEEIIGQAFGKEKVLYTIAEAMDPIRHGNNLKYTKAGYVNIGIDTQDEEKKEKLNKVLEFFDKTGFPYKLEKDVKQRLWSKFMLNVGVNQAMMIYEATYKTIQKPGPARNLMIDAMKEVIELAKKENIKVTEDDLNFYVSIIDTLNPDGMASMRYDGLHKKKSEVDLFSGTVIRLGKKHGVATPINQHIYETIKEIESKY